MEGTCRGESSGSAAGGEGEGEALSLVWLGEGMGVVVGIAWVWQKYFFVGCVDCVEWGSADSSMGVDMWNRGLDVLFLSKIYVGFVECLALHARLTASSPLQLQPCSLPMFCQARKAIA